MLKTTKTQSHLRLVADRGVLLDDRKYAQSTSGRISSQLTSPLDSRSMLIASDSLQGLEPYATFRKCPQVVPHRSANESRSVCSIGERKDFRSMVDYHHTVMENSTPNVDFTKRCGSVHILEMENEATDARRKNLQRLILRDYNDNQSLFARDYWRVNGLAGVPRQSFISDLISGRVDPATKKPKSFGEKTARNVERTAGLLRHELDHPDSPLRLDPSRAPAASQLHAEIADAHADPDLAREMLQAVRQAKAKYASRHKAS